MTKQKLAISSEQITESIVYGMREMGAKDIVVLDLRELQSAAADFFIICHGTITTHVEAIARSVESATQEQWMERPEHIEGKQNAQWILMDYFSVLAHIFEEKTRAYYDLEGLWADAAVENISEKA